ncbi:ADP-ribosylglycohydrolase family protein [Streptosporangium roseum]|uniref:ADP-ribosylglycohydrolase family protein n=1 Tax=Streptosporangium roseum TaxID=2001 RepID=UPI0004CCECBA|nr:ADP-ribosylglycohydrolase family protein [Streptosporangium roseum]
MRRPIDDLPEYRSRVRGCLLGGALGDALGAPVEFDSLGEIRRQYGPAGLTEPAPDQRGRVGLITDDTQMTLFTVEGLIRGEDVTAVQRAYLRWLDTQQHPSPPPADGGVRTGRLREQRWLYSRRAPGNACLSGLRHSKAVSPAPFGEPGPVNPGSKGCGTVMRSAPFGLRARSARHAFELAAECAQITHGHPTGYLAAGAFAAIVHFLMNDLATDHSATDSPPLAHAVRRTMDLLSACPSHEETTGALRAAVSLAAEGAPSPEKVESLGGAWIAEEALAIAVYCALVTPEPGDIRRALLLAVNHSGDSDSTGAVCGNLLGALHGETALPGDWLVHLEGRDAITELADDFAAQSTGGHEATGDWLTKYPGD